MVKPSTTKREEGAKRMSQAQTAKMPWPNLEKKYKLRTQTVIPAQILTISNLLSTEECNEFVQSLDDHQSGLGSCVRFETTNRIPKRGEAFRYNERISVYDPRFAQVLWSKTGLNHFFERWFSSSAGQDNQEDDLSRKKCWGLNPNIRIYRYQVGHKFEKHYDESVKISTLPDFREHLARSDPNNSVNKTQSWSDFPHALSTEYTLLIYLTGSEDCEKDSGEEKRLGQSSANKLGMLRGGETVFYSSNSSFTSFKERPANPDKKSKESPQNKQREDQSIAASVSPIAGLALIHRHGSKCLLHEGREVTSGVKYVLRSDVMFG